MAHRVLVVDDDAAFRGLACRLIVGMGLRVAGEAGTFAEGEAGADALRPDAALVDVGLPDGDGIELARRLAALPWRPRVVLTSSDADAVSAETARDLGATGFLPKGALADGSLRRLLAGVPQDDVLLREGVARLLADAGCDVVARAGDAEGTAR